MNASPRRKLSGMVAFLLWLLLFVVAWPLALAALFLYPIIWLLLLPFRIVGIAEPNRELAERYARRYGLDTAILFPSLPAMLDAVFGPDCWSFEVGTIKPITLPNNDQLIYVPGKMTVRFADGSQVVRSDVGIGLVQAKIDSPDLSDLGADTFETGYKSATTDALKGCAADLGRCFRPSWPGGC